jgi:hypothetical protein
MVLSVAKILIICKILIISCKNLKILSKSVQKKYMYDLNFEIGCKTPIAEKNPFIIYLA